MIKNPKGNFAFIFTYFKAMPTKKTDFFFLTYVIVMVLYGDPLCFTHYSLCLVRNANMQPLPERVG